MDNVDVRAFAMAERYKIAGKTKVPVVVMLDQGASPAGNGSNDDALLPVGALAIGEAGDFADPTNWIESPIKKDGADDKRFPVRMFHLVDASPSMESYPGTGAYSSKNTKLKLVQKTIKRLADNLPDGIKHVLIPYSDRLHPDEGGVYDKPNELITAIEKLTTRGGTNIGIPIAEALRQIKENPNASEGEEYRNLINLISDGQASPNPPLALAKTYPQHNAGSFGVGVGIGYNESLMHGILENSAFGGFAHIPQTGKGAPLDVFGKILPEFVSQMVSAPYYPIIKFNKWFDSVVNMTPSTRNVNIEDNPQKIPELNNDFFKYRAAVGYQNRSFVVGFIDEDKLEGARVNLELKESASRDPIHDKELRIEDFDPLGLDPKDLELLRNAPFEALKMQIIKERDYNKIQEFLDENKDLDPRFRKRLEVLIQQLQSYTASGDDNSMMTVTGDESMSFTGATMGIVPFSPDLSLHAASGDEEPGETQGNLGDDYTRAAAPPAEINIVDELPRQENSLSLKFVPIKSTATMSKDGVACNDFVLNPGERLSFGRTKKTNDIALLGSKSVSRNHGYFYLDKERDLFIVDNDSSHGIQINDGPKLTPGQAEKIRDKDIIEIAGNSFRVDFS